jgi:hypothetical protein
MVGEKLLTNCPITIHNVDNATQIFAPDLANLRGKTMGVKPDHIRVKYARISKNFIQLHKHMILVADVMFVNGLPFLVTSSRGIRLVTIKHLPSQTAKCLVHTLEQVFRIYGSARFVVQTTMMDMEFDMLKNLLPHVALNTMAAREHVGKIKRKIRVIKERARVRGSGGKNVIFSNGPISTSECSKLLY